MASSVPGPQAAEAAGVEAASQLEAEASLVKAGAASELAELAGA